MVKFKTFLTKKQFRFLLMVMGLAEGVDYRHGTEAKEVIGQSVFSGKTIIFKEEDEMKEMTVDEINRALTTAAEADAAEVEESPFPIPFSELPAQPEWDEEQPLGPPPSEEEEDNGGEF